MTLPSTLHLFERPCLPGWLYPCTLDDIASSIARLPEQDLEGLWAVGLVPSTRKNNNAYGSYWFAPKPKVYLWSYPESLRFKLRANAKISEIERGLKAELQYGMKIEREGGRYVCAWSLENLRRFMVEHVLLHEIGHHVFFWGRKQQGLPYNIYVPGDEQFAEDYALRQAREQKEVVP